MIGILLSPLGRYGLMAAGVVAFLVAFSMRDRAIEARGAEKAVARINEATNEAISKAHSAGGKSRSPKSPGVQLPYYRD